ncbi:MAG: nucleotidyltransferase domain-containing protein [candidate division WOR-3 bacterium]|nr:nucleotidyltransferase domain-containing protein [candidate division WOR-3 bacterium]MDH5683778.1 nucleotidyltransferase domain-containing protein [candidate division WOR-3 bacterium]
MLANLISSKARIEILKLLILNPDNSYYQREIAQLTKLPIQSVQRELKNFSSIGLTEIKTRGNRKFYSANRNFPIFKELKSILLKTSVLGDVLKQALLKSKNEIRLAFIYGSYAEQQEKISSDIDLFVVGSISSRTLSSILSSVKKELQREINFTVYPTDEFKQGVRTKKHFISRVLQGKKIFLIGDDNAIQAIVG